MPKANFKNVFFLTLFTTVITLNGCKKPEEKKAETIEKAQILTEKGSNTEALKLLEKLAPQYPNDIEILESMGRIYSNEGDHKMAAFFLEQAHLQAPDDAKLLLQTYSSLQAANQPAGHLLEKLAEQTPDALTPELWIRLGQNRATENKIQPALDAYLMGVDPETSKPDAETAASIGQLFAKVGNLPQAEAWLEMAVDQDDPNALTSLFGLLEIKLRQKNWPGAEATIARLDKQFPGAVDASQWKQAREELTNWRKAQDEMKAKLAEAETEKSATEAGAAETDQSAAELADSKEPTGIATESKAQVIADIETAEAMADTPAIEATEEIAVEETLDKPENTPSTSEADNSETIVYNPDIAIEPAEPEITFDVDFDQESIAEPTNYAVTTAEPESVLEETFRGIEEQASDRPLTVEELLADAETAEIDRDFKSAIRKYWAAISIADNPAEIWNLLSRAYLVDGQLNNAETAALEAVRLSPGEVAYTLDYLRVTQRSKNPEDFLSELQTAYDRFPASPEITLSLARAHERISEDNVTARNLYLRFIDIAPNHPLIPEARDAVARLR
ncbi:MAG: tetratricopeptide repeat protein [Opitutales bacterium]